MSLYMRVQSEVLGRFLFLEKLCFVFFFNQVKPFFDRLTVRAFNGSNSAKINTKLSKNGW